MKTPIFVLTIFCLFMLFSMDYVNAMGWIHLDAGTTEANKIIKTAVIFYWFGSASGTSVNHNLNDIVKKDG